MSTPNLFESLQSMRRQTRPIVIQPGQKMTVEDERGNILSKPIPLPHTGPIRFDVQSLTSDEMIDADSLITATPPAKYQEEPNPRGVGVINVHIGYDEECPKYLAERHTQSYQRDAAVCLYGCPALMETTPGSSMAEKVKAITQNIPAALLSWLANEIDTLTVITAVGEEDVERFFPAGSEAGKNSPDSAAAPRTKSKGKSSKA
jgi:hypothetical protein